jgi:hypothetical protein
MNKHTTIQDTVFPMWSLLGNVYVCNSSRTIGSDVFYVVHAKVRMNMKRVMSQGYVMTDNQSDSCRFVDVGCPLWREDRSVTYNCCWSSPTQSYLLSVNPNGHFASWVLIQFLWWPLFCLLLTRPHWEANSRSRSWRLSVYVKGKVIWRYMGEWMCRSTFSWPQQ